MRFRIQVTDDRGKPWWEEYDKHVGNAEEWARRTIDSFNQTLRPEERPRELLSVEVLDVASRKDHDWRKQNAFTITRGGLSYDVMRCDRCGITGKRYGLGTVTLDPKFAKAKVYQRCDTAQAHLERLVRRKAVS